MSENNMPASLPDGFESRIRNQAGSIIFKVFGPQDLRSKPPSKIVWQLARLQDLIAEALLAAHNATLAAPDAAQELLRSLIPELCEYCAGPVNGFTFPLKQWGVPENNNVSFSHTGTLNHTPCGADQIHTFLLLNKTPTGDAVRQARRETLADTDDYKSKQAARLIASLLKQKGVKFDSDLVDEMQRIVAAALRAEKGEENG